MLRHARHILRLKGQQLAQPRRRRDVRHLFQRHDQMAARVHPSEQRVDLARAQIDRHLGVEIDRIQRFQHERVVGENGRLEPRRHRLRIRLVALDRQ